MAKKIQCWINEIEPTVKDIAGERLQQLEDFTVFCDHEKLPTDEHKGNKMGNFSCHG